MTSECVGEVVPPIPQEWRVAFGVARIQVSVHSTEEYAWKVARMYNEAAGGSLGRDPFVVQSRPKVYWEDA